MVGYLENFSGNTIYLYGITILFRGEIGKGRCPQCDLYNQSRSFVCFSFLLPNLSFNQI